MEAALEALARVDRPDRALPPILARLEGERAPAAARALLRIARRLPPGALEPHVLELASGDRLEVAVHVGVVRLLGTLDNEPATRALLATWDRADLQPEVRLAALGACGRLLHRPEVARVLAEAGATTQRELALGLIRPWPARVPPHHRGAWALQIR